MRAFDEWLLNFTDNPLNVALLAGAAFLVALSFLWLDQVVFYTTLIVKSFRRNVLRSTLTSMAIMVLVLVVTLVWSVLNLLDKVTSDKARDFKAIVSERWQIPSQMPYSYVSGLARGGARTGSDIVPMDSMTWTFYGGTTDPVNRTRENIVFFFGMNPQKMMLIQRDEKGNPLRDRDGKLIYSSMMDDIDQATEEEMLDLDRHCREMEKDRSKVVIGRDKLDSMKKKIGERIKVTSFNYPGVDLEVEIVGTFPKGRYDASSLVNIQYILDGIDAWKQKNGKPHPMAEKCLNLVWLKVPDTEAFRQVADQIITSPEFKSPAVKVETASSGIASFLDSYRDLLWAVRWILVPAILATMVLVIANAISISVRERRTEMAVLKVLGFSPTQVMILVLGEAIFIGVISGMISAGIAYIAINARGGLKFPIAFFPAFKVPDEAIWWGLMIGGATGVLGSLLPAWSARSVKVAEVFSKTA
ncbi:MAG: ABC transporter permease [Planctomycetia bacterium]|nr:ABC transporter permease [Planctomycetia bacterium]